MKGWRKKEIKRERVGESQSKCTCVNWIVSTFDTSSSEIIAIWSSPLLTLERTVYAHSLWRPKITRRHIKTQRHWYGGARNSFRKHAKSHNIHVAFTSANHKNISYRRRYCLLFLRNALQCYATTAVTSNCSKPFPCEIIEIFSEIWSTIAMNRRR